MKSLPSRARLPLLITAILAVILLVNQYPSTARRQWTSAAALVSRTNLLRERARAPRPAIQHPIPSLMANARRQYAQKVARQSKTLEAAVAEYEKRYNKRPPAGFDEWFQFAQDNNAVMIDEYDQLSRDLEPFWMISGKELRKRCIDVGYLPSVDLVRVENGQTRTLDVSKGFDDSEVGARAKGFRV